MAVEESKRYDLATLEKVAVSPHTNKKSVIIQNARYDLQNGERRFILNDIKDSVT